MGLVVLLYEQALEDLRHAVAALEKKDIEARTLHINHAILVIGQLQASLDMQQGGEVARNLQDFYNVVRCGLVEAQAQGAAEEIKKQISLLMLVREAWVEVERELATPVPSTEQSAQTAVVTGSRTFGGWSV